MINNKGEMYDIEDPAELSTDEFENTKYIKFFPDRVDYDGAYVLEEILSRYGNDCMTKNFPNIVRFSLG